MSSEIRGLYVGSSNMDIEPHERAFRAIGAEVDRVEDADLGAIIEAVKDADVLISEGHKLDAQLFDHMGINGRCQGYGLVWPRLRRNRRGGRQRKMAWSCRTPRLSERKRSPTTP